MKDNNKKNSLLFAAKLYTPKVKQSKHPITEDEMELAVAYLAGEVSHRQVGEAYVSAGILKSPNPATRIKNVLTVAYKTGKLIYKE